MDQPHTPRFATGGRIPGRGLPVKTLEPGEFVVTPERAEQVGLTVDAKRMRKKRSREIDIRSKDERWFLWVNRHGFGFRLGLVETQVYLYERS